MIGDALRIAFGIPAIGVMLLVKLGVTKCKKWLNNFTKSSDT